MAAQRWAAKAERKGRTMDTTMTAKTDVEAMVARAKVGGKMLMRYNLSLKVVEWRVSSPENMSQSKTKTQKKSNEQTKPPRFRT